MAYKKRSFLISIVLFLSITLYSQNKYMPPNPYYGRDGEHWTRFIITNPGYMGPNALPVPELNSGNLGSEIRLQSGYAYHLNKYDPTFNLLSRLYYPLYKDKIALEFSIVPIEIFDMDSIARFNRHTRDMRGEGLAMGDFYFGTHIQLFRDHKVMPDMVFRLVCKTASGIGLAEARYTDAPGYYLDINFGKNIRKFGSGKVQSRFTGMMGFFSWQTYLKNNRQNDAFIYGAGLLLSHKKWEFHNNVSGYVGYMRLGDQPMIFRSDFTFKAKKTDFRIGYRWGINDYDYQSFIFSLIWHWEKKLK
ncbi:hypothetical protein ACFLTI_08000 [Bacteroidota bacterium]